jgi:hypothetical protein
MWLEARHVVHLQEETSLAPDALKNPYIPEVLEADKLAEVHLVEGP